MEFYRFGLRVQELLRENSSTGTLWHRPVVGSDCCFECINVASKPISAVCLCTRFISIYFLLAMFNSYVVLSFNVFTAQWLLCLQPLGLTSQTTIVQTYVFTDGGLTSAAHYCEVTSAAILLGKCEHIAQRERVCLRPHEFPPTKTSWLDPTEETSQ